MLKRMKTVIFVIALAIAACNCEGVEVGFTGGVFSQDGYYVSCTNQLLELYASVADIVVHGAAPGEFSTRAPIGYRWYIDDVLQEGLNGEAITLSYGQGGIKSPATYTVKCEVRIGLHGDGGANWLSDWMEVGTREVTFFKLFYKSKNGISISNTNVVAGGEEQVRYVLIPNIEDTINFISTSGYMLLKVEKASKTLFISSSIPGHTGDIIARYRGCNVENLHVASTEAKIDIKYKM